MAKAVQSIDFAASGLMRHRFMRALGASYQAFYLSLFPVAALLWLILPWVVPSFASPFGLGNFGGVVLAAVMLVAATTNMTLLSLPFAAYDAIPRRLVALVWFAIGACSFVVCVGGVIFVLIGIAQVLLEFIGYPASSLGGAPLGWSSLFLALLLFPAFEILRWAWWQLVTSRASFSAARGWRASFWRLGSNFRRRLGLPTFLSTMKRGTRRLSIGYFGVAVLNANILLAILLIYVISRDSRTQSFSPAAGLLLAILTGVLLCLNALGAGRSLAQLLNRRVSMIYQQVRDWDARPPVVFLRAFKQDRTRLEPAALDPLVRAAAGIGASRTLDEILIEHATPYGPLIAIGDPQNPTPPLGAARIFVSGADAGWQRIVTDLVGASCAVVMCPTSSAGVQWELDLLARTKANTRTIFLANPNLSSAGVNELFRALPIDVDHSLIGKGQTAIAAYQDPMMGWRLLTTKRRSLESYTIALNISLQGLLGLKGVRLEQPIDAKQSQSDDWDGLRLAVETARKQTRAAPEGSNRADEPSFPSKTTGATGSQRSRTETASIDKQNDGPVWLVIETDEQNRIAVARLIREFFPEMTYAVLAKVVAGAKLQLDSNAAEELREALEERGGRATIWKESS